MTLANSLYNNYTIQSDLQFSLQMYTLHKGILFFFFNLAYLGLFHYVNFRLFFSGLIRKKSASEEACIEP